MPNIDLLTIRMTPENIRLIEDEAISLFRSHSKAGPIDANHWLEQYIPTIIEDGKEAQYDLIADKLLESGSWILQVLQCYRRAIRLAMLYIMKAALLGKEGTDPDEKGFISEGMQNIKLRKAQTQKENEFLEAFLAYCKKHHRPNVGIPVSADGVEAYLAPVQKPPQPVKTPPKTNNAPTQKRPTDTRTASADVKSPVAPSPAPSEPPVQALREREVFATYYDNYLTKLAQNPLRLNVTLSDVTLSVSPYAAKVQSYKDRVDEQIKQKKEVAEAERARKRAEELAEYERKRAEEKAEWERKRAANLAAYEKERKAKLTFNILTWIFCVVAVAAKAVLLFIEPITLFAIVPVVGIDILYGFMVGWIGKSNERSRGRCTVQTLIEVGMSAIVVVIAFLMMENALPILIAQGVACLISIVATLIMRGKIH